MDVISAAAAAFALTAGVVAAFNPCGFALLPAYLAIIVNGTSEASLTRAGALRRAATFGLAMTLGFSLVFSVFGLIFALANAGLQGDVLPYVSYVTVVLGVLLVALGVHMARGGEVKVPGLRLAGSAPRATFASQVLYGASFAIASMSCTIGPFLAVVAGALDAGNPLGAAAPFLIYAAGMGTSVLAVSLIAAVAGATVVAGLRRRTPAIMRVAGWLMVVAGAYVVLYGLAEILPTYDIHSLDAVLLETARWQGSVSHALASRGAGVLTAAAIVTGLVVIALFVWSRGSSDAPTEPTAPRASSGKASSPRPRSAGGGSGGSTKKK